ncbi:hypothetical protein [Psychrobacter immobilis]|uniref:hypothetical protein n=1 Tax=Psychrobacter immobilis TaxID=498 RepID=UPI001918A26F|nr:hypothetical protein [Psychrobacter immobilis]
MHTLDSTPKKQLLKSKRVSISIRLLDDDHTELKDTANEQQRSMSFVAMRRYMKGRNQELSSIDIYHDNTNLKEGVKNVK